LGTQIKNKKEIVDLSTLNSDQKKAFDELRDFISNKDDDSIYVLKGWAGTGKTYCISLLVKYVLEVMHKNSSWYKIAVTGPTNKSVRVIKRTSGLINPRIVFQTIHKLLGLTEKITHDGKQEFVNQGDFRPQIHTVRLLIIDEVSMLNDDLFHDIIKFRDKVKIICMGDPAQIPPVGKPDCIPFIPEVAEEYGIKTLELKQIMRQKEGNSIIESSVAIRSDLGRRNNPVEPVSTVNDKGEGVEFMNLNSVEMRKGFSSVLANYFKTKEFEEDSEYAKVIAWRNKTVATMNDLIRKVIYGEEATKSKILIGEKLIANNPVIQEGMVLLNTNEEFTVEQFDIRTENIKSMLDPYSLKYYETEVAYLDDEGKKRKVWIEILHEESEWEFKKRADELKKIAIEKKGKDKSWIAYYDFLRKFADVNYAYAITAHKSQGSTYTTTFVLEDDIDMNLDIIERNRIKYTSYTRSSKKLYVLKRF
jgi:exodeoxyribonuclease-5